MRSKSPVLMENIKDYAERYFLKNFKSPTKAQIAQALNITPGTVTKYLKDMKDMGMIEYDGYTVHTENTHKYNSPMCSAAILGSVSCGPLLFENENIEGYIALPEAVFGKGAEFDKHIQFCPCAYLPDNRSHQKRSKYAQCHCAECI